MRKKCFAYSVKGVCKALRIDKCNGIACPFYQTEEQIEESRRKAELLLSNVHPLGQKYIAEKYYDGNISCVKDGICK